MSGNNHRVLGQVRAQKRSACPVRWIGINFANFYKGKFRMAFFSERHGGGGSNISQDMTSHSALQNRFPQWLCSEATSA